MKTTVATVKDEVRPWFLVDATDKPAGRLASRIAMILRGKNRPDYTPHGDTGAFVVVINAEKVKLTGAKETKKLYKRFTGYPSGLKETPAEVVRKKNPTYIITHAVEGMLPDNNISRTLASRLKVYAGPDHPHKAQKPVALDLGI